MSTSIYGPQPEPNPAPYDVSVMDGPVVSDATASEVQPTDVPVVNPLAGPPAVVDSVGTPITVGLTVKLVGTVIAVSATDTHGLGVTVQPNNPTIVAITDILPQQATVLMPVSPLPGKPFFRFHGTQLTVGS
jgi:hypothetical protein